MPSAALSRTIRSPTQGLLVCTAENWRGPQQRSPAKSFSPVFNDVVGLSPACVKRTKLSPVRSSPLRELWTQKTVHGGKDSTQPDFTVLRLQSVSVVFSGPRWVSSPSMRHHELLLKDSTMGSGPGPNLFHHSDIVPRPGAAVPVLVCFTSNTAAISDLTGFDTWGATHLAETLAFLMRAVIVSSRNVSL